MRLQEYGKAFQTDKSDKHHEFAGETYLDIYERYLSKLKDSPVNLLEIGVRDGCSHRMWSSWFSNPESKIVGIDIDPRCSAVDNGGKLRVVIGSQGDAEVVDRAVSLVDSGFDVIIDDGSHVNELTIKSFELLFKHLKSGGLYIIEDLGCSYLEEKLEKDIKVGAWPGMQYNSGVKMINRRRDLDLFFLRLIKSMDLLESGVGVKAVHFHSRIVVIEKV